MMDENEMANAIIQSAGDQISEGTALYLDGELTAVCSDGNALRDYLAAMLDPYEEEEDDPDVSVGFNKQVTLEDGLYFKEGLQDFETVRQELVGVKQAQKVYTVKAGDTLWSIAHNNDLTFRELCALNPAFKGEPLSETSSILEGDHLVITKEEAGLEVRIETREEEIAFSTETTKSNEYTKGTTKVLQEGENGLRRVTLQNVYDTKNILVDQSVLSTEVIKEPVNKKVVEGTKKVTSSTKYITGSGLCRTTATARAGTADVTRAWTSAPRPVRPSTPPQAVPSPRRVTTRPVQVRAMATRSSSTTAVDTALCMRTACP